MAGALRRRLENEKMRKQHPGQLKTQSLWITTQSLLQIRDGPDMAHSAGAATPENIEKRCSSIEEIADKIMQTLGGGQLESKADRSALIARLDSISRSILYRQYGPNAKEVEDLVGIQARRQMLSSASLSLADTRQALEKRMQTIQGNWKLLLPCRINCLERMWVVTTQEDRRSWLRAKLPDVAEFYGDFTHILATAAKETWSKLRPTIFQCPMLNLEHLSLGTNLIKLLRSRVDKHPQLFLKADSACSELPLQTGSWRPVICDGRLQFTPPNGEYGYRLEPIGKETFLWYDPFFGISQLECQSKMYSFLVSCLELPAPPAGQAVSFGLASGGRFETEASDTTLLQEICYLDYTTSEIFDTNYVRSLINQACEDAFDYLRDLRTSIDRWEELVLAFDWRLVLRQSLFTAGILDDLRNLFITLFANHDASISFDSSPPENLQSFITLEVALQHTVNELMNLVTEFPATDTGNDLSRLLQFLKTRDVTIWTMNIVPLVAAIDRESRRSKNVEDLPVVISQLLTTILILIYCVRKTQHYHAISTPGQLLSYSIIQAERGWQDRSREWLDTAVKTIDSIPTRKMNDCLRSTKSPQQKHRVFWGNIDIAMAKVNPTQASLIQRDMPLPPCPASPSEETPTALSLPPLEPSTTRLRKSRSRSGRRQQPISAKSIRSGAPLDIMDEVDKTRVIAASTPLPQISGTSTGCRHDVSETMLCNASPGLSKPLFYATQGTKQIIKVSRKVNFDFWLQENAHRNVSWIEFKQQMAALGFSISTTCGSGYRFQRGNNLFFCHQPHGTDKRHFPVWRQSILRHFVIMQG